MPHDTTGTSDIRLAELMAAQSLAADLFFTEAQFDTACWAMADLTDLKSL